MNGMLKNIKNFKKKVQFINDSLAVAAQHLDEEKVMSREQKYSIVEPYIEMLINSTETDDVVIPTELKEIAEQLENNMKIQAIKQFRTVFGAELKDSKNEVERVHNSGCWLVDEWIYNGRLIWRRGD